MGKGNLQVLGPTLVAAVLYGVAQGAQPQVRLRALDETLGAFHTLLGGWLHMGDEAREAEVVCVWLQSFGL